MTDKQIDANLSYKRALEVLCRIDSPKYLFAMWRMIKFYETCPAIERYDPWYKGIENLIA